MSMIDDAKGWILAWWLKKPPIEFAKTRKPNNKPLPDPPVFRDKYEERVDPEFDQMIKGIVADIKNR